MEAEKGILVLFTGGTIGGVKVVLETGQTIIVQPSEARKYGIKEADLVSLLISKYQEFFPNGFMSFKTKAIMEEFSEDFTVDKLATLTRALKDINFNDYKGVIITHGTDTLGYTANYLATILNQSEVPVVMVSSNYTLEDSKANGVLNFKAAIDFINNYTIPGVYVTFCNNVFLSNPETNIFYGSRVTQCQAPTDIFNCISANKTAHMPLAKINVNGDLSVIDNQLFSTLQYVTPTGQNYLNKMAGLKGNVVQINPYPGMNYDFINLSSEIDAILHSFYHSGTACTKGNNSEKIDSFIRMCDKKEIDIWLGPVYGKNDKDIYGTMQCYTDRNIIMNTSIENAYAKLLVAYYLFDKEADRAEFLFSDVNQEHISPYYKLGR